MTISGEAILRNNNPFKQNFGIQLNLCGVLQEYRPDGAGSNRSAMMWQAELQCLEE